MNTKVMGCQMLAAINGKHIAASTNARLQISTENITALGESPLVHDHLIGRCGWQLSVDTFYTLSGGTTIAQALIGRQLVDVLMLIGTHTYTGKAYVTNYNVRGNVRGKVTVSFELTGHGAIAPGTAYPSVEVPDNPHYVSGHEMILAESGTEVRALLTENSLDLSLQLDETVHANGWRTYRPTRYDWQVKASALLDADTQPPHLEVGRRAQMTTRIGFDTYTGTAIITSASLDGPLKQAATLKLDAVGCSDLTTAEPSAQRFTLDFNLIF